MRVLIINGSHRKENTDIATEVLSRELTTTRAEVRELILRDIEMKFPDGCTACAESKICPNIEDQFVREIEPTIRDYDAYVIATPIYSDAVTPLIKIFWDRIVSWCAEERMYLRGKKIAVVAHGMAGEESSQKVIDWVKGFCDWEECVFTGALGLDSGSEVGSIKVNEVELKKFVEDLLR